MTVGQLERAVDAGQPPIVDLQAWRDTALPWRETWDAGHYVLLVGYDAERLFVMDPSIMTPGAYAFLPRAELDERWHDLAGPEDARLLGVDVGLPLLLLSRHAFDTSGQPVEFAQSWYRGDRYKFVTRLRRQSPEPQE